MTEIALTGLRPDRLVAVLALMGLMRALETARPAWTPRVAWRGRPWRPVLHADADPLDETAVAEAALDGLHAWAPAFDFDGHRDLNHHPDAFRAWAASRLDDPGAAAVASALASDGVSKRTDAGTVEPTPFCAMFGQGHQHFLLRLGGNVDARETPSEEIADALFRWRYEPEGALRGKRRIPKTSMRWDPAEERRYALGAQDPSDLAVRTVPGANRLAALGLTLLPVVPGAARLEATGVRRREGRVEITWPVWTGALGVGALTPLLDHPKLQDDQPARAELEPLGVGEVYRCTRAHVGKFMSFTPAAPLWGHAPVAPEPAADASAS